MSQISIETLRALLDYNPETGDLTWKPRQEGPKQWNSRMAGRRVTVLHKDGYIVVTIYNRQYKAHRVAWAIETGKWPIGPVDHKNGIRSDNRKENLSEATPRTNARNRKRPSHNSSGHIGVNKAYGNTLAASIMANGVREYLGAYGCVTAAAVARKRAEIRHGYSASHGRER